MPIDYSRWKDIEISDDEDDTHPNVDTPSLFKWRHEARLQRMQEQDVKKRDIVEQINTYAKKLESVREQLKDEALDEESKKRLQAELDEVKKQEDDWRRKEEELNKEESLKPWNVDTISHEVFTTTRINKATPPEEIDKPLSEEEESAFYDKNLAKVKEFALLRKYDDSQEFLIKHPELCCSETANLLCVVSLNYELEGKHELMAHVAHQVVIINYLIELAKALSANPKSPDLVKTFFAKMKTAKTSDDMLHEDVEVLKERIKKRAQEKTAEAMKEVEAEERAKRLGPGGLDPLEVMETLPESMRKCFETRDVEMLKGVALEMDDKEFYYHFQRCVDSGLWVAGDEKRADAKDSEQPLGAPPKAEEKKKEKEQAPGHSKGQ